MQIRPKSHAACSSAFTLTETLVVIVILVTIALLAFSGLSRMRNAADKATSTRNLAQLQLANASYAADNAGKYVPIYSFDESRTKTSQWTSNPDFLIHFKADGVYTSTGKVSTKLPLNLMDPVTVRAKKKGYDTLDASYGYNSTGLPGYNQPSIAAAYRMSQLSSPERTAAFITATDWIVHHGSRFKWAEAAAVEGRTNDQKMAYRHGRKALVAYYDGHVGEVSTSDIREIDKQGGVNHAFWNGSSK